MTDGADVNAAAVQATKELRARARAEHGGNTRPLMVVYSVESFLRRLALSDHSGRMVLKNARGRRHGEFVIPTRAAVPFGELAER